MLLIPTAEPRDARTLGELGAALMRIHYAFDPQPFLAAGDHAERGYAYQSNVARRVALSRRGARARA
jgi:hypothetical protein